MASAYPATNKQFDTGQVRALIDAFTPRPIRDTLNFTQLILRIALYFAPLKLFLPLSGLLLLAAVAWGLFSTLVFHQLADVSTLVIVMTAAQVAAIGLLAELINRRFPSQARMWRAQQPAYRRQPETTVAAMPSESRTTASR